MEQILFLLLLPALGYFFGSRAESRHYASIGQREKQLQPLPAVTIKTVDYPDKQINKVELVQGSVVISTDYFKKIMAGLRNVFGGRVTSYESLVDRARREAVLRMKEAAEDAHIIVGTRIETSAVGKHANQRRTIGSVEAIAYGTAITYTSKKIIR